MSERIQPIASASPSIGGRTRLFPIIGDPVSQVRSPAMFNSRFAGAGIDAVMVPMHVLEAEFEATMQGLMRLGNLDGIVVTVPYKAKVLDFAHKVLPTASRAGAANALRREQDGTWTADLFDGKGLTRGLRLRGLSVRGRRVALIGAGGAGSAVAVAFADEGASLIAVHDVVPEKALALTRRLQPLYPDCEFQVSAEFAAGFDVLVNCTPVGMRPDDGMPAELGDPPATLLVIDVIMTPAVTPLMRHATDRGCRVVGGMAMLEGQADEVMSFFGFTDRGRALGESAI